MPKTQLPVWEEKARQRLMKAIARHKKALVDLCDRDANEADTRLWINHLVDGFGFDEFKEISTEFGVRSEYADYLLKLDQQPVCFVEVSGARPDFYDRHLAQVERYATHQGYSNGLF